MWQKKGLIFKPSGHTWQKSHAQVPTPFLFSKDVLRVYYCSRDQSNISRISFVDLDSNDVSKIVYEHPLPILEPGQAGTFDDCGVMPSWVTVNGNSVFLYYIGWNVRNTVPYYNSVGLAVSDDGGTTFRKFSEGPLWDRNFIEPYFSASTCVIFDNDIWKCWYLSCTEYRLYNGKYEPRYHLKYCESKDGIRWIREGRVAIDYKNDNEAGIVKASVLKEEGIYKMWYSFRNFDNYRTDSVNSYKIGYAESNDGLQWIRHDDQVKFHNSDFVWDNQMMCYPHVLHLGARKIMFYNGNGFGQNGFGYAIEKKEDDILF